MENEVSTAIKIVLVTIFIAMFAVVYAYNLTQANQSGSSIALASQNASFTAMSNQTAKLSGYFVNLTQSFALHPCSNSTEFFGVQYCVVYQLPGIGTLFDIFVAIANIFAIIGGEIGLVLSIGFVINSILTSSGFGIFAPIIAILITGIGIILQVFIVWLLSVIFNRLIGGLGE